MAISRRPLDERVGQFRDIEAAIRLKSKALVAVLDERRLRLWAGVEAVAIGPGGISVVARATGLARERIGAGIRELKGGLPAEKPQNQRIRRIGAGRPKITAKDPGLLDAIEALVEPTRRGDPESPLRWTTKSTRHLAAELTKAGHKVSATKVGELLTELGYTLQATKKTKEGAQHADRDAQFNRIAERTINFMNRGMPVISVDTKKKELIGDFKNGGREWHPKGEPTKAKTHDFPSQAEGRAIPYGVYDIAAENGWVNIGSDHDTPQFAVASIEGWWRSIGSKAYPQATELLITADAGGSNAYRSRLWKLELQRLSSTTGLVIHVLHFPPGTSKWNRIEHSMFSAISMNWRGRTLLTYETIIQLIGATTNSKGLHLTAHRDAGTYPTGIKVTNAKFSAINITRDPFHGEWNYSIAPRSENDVSE